MVRNPTTVAHSPLYTPKDKAKFKAALLRRLGPDVDGASRVTNRIDDGADVQVINEMRVLENV